VCACVRVSVGTERESGRQTDRHTGCCTGAPGRGACNQENGPPKGAGRAGSAASARARKAHGRWGPKHVRPAGKPACRPWAAPAPGAGRPAPRNGQRRRPRGQGGLHDVHPRSATAARARGLLSAGGVHQGPPLVGRWRARARAQGPRQRWCRLKRAPARARPRPRRRPRPAAACPCRAPCSRGSCLAGAARAGGGALAQQAAAGGRRRGGRSPRNEQSPRVTRVWQ
jgi:hypothetical protein